MKKHKGKLYLWCYINNGFVAPRGFAKDYKSCMESNDKERLDLFKLYELKEVKNAKKS